MSWQRSSRHTFPSHITGVKDARGLQVLSVGYNAMGRVETLSDLYIPGKRDRIWVKEYLPLRSHPYWRPTTLPGVKRATACRRRPLLRYVRHVAHANASVCTAIEGQGLIRPFAVSFLGRPCGRKTPK